jgi:membrane-bound serine protease (ClpP class)
MNILLDPNVAYLILVMGFFLAVLALFAPGTGLLEAGALIALLLSGYAIYNLPINGWALVILLLGVFPFLWGIRRSKRIIFLVISIVLIAAGSIGLFRNENGGFAVNPVLAIAASIAVPVFLWIAGTKAIQAMRKKPSHDLGGLIGKLGEARTDIDLVKEGSVYVGGETWSARSTGHIQAGTLVRVLKREGFILYVEPENTQAPIAAETPPSAP